MLEAEAVAAQAAVVAAKRAFLRMDAAPVDPSLLAGAKAVFVRGSGWRLVVRVSAKSVTIRDLFAAELRVPLDQIVAVR